MNKKQCMYLVCILALVPYCRGMSSSSATSSTYVPSSSSSAQTSQTTVSATSLAQEAAPKMPLWKAAEEGDLAAVNWYLSHGANPDSRGPGEETPLQVASSRGHAKIVEALIKAGADLNKYDRSGNTALMFAIDQKHFSVAKQLIDAGADVNIQEQYGLFSPLIRAACHGYEDLTRDLIAAGADLNERDLNGNTALMNAIIYKNFSVAKKLIAAGALLDVQDVNEKTAFDYAQESRDEEIIELLEREIKKRQLAGENANFPLIKAAKKNDVENERELLKSKLDVQKVKAQPKQAKPKAQAKAKIAISALLRRSLNATINDTSNFYISKSENELHKIIRLSNEALANSDILQAYSQEFGKTIPELKSLLNKLKAKTRQVLEAIKKKTQHKSAKQTQSESASATQASHYSLYIMLDVPNVNSKGQPINWQDAIDKIMSQIDMPFVADKYHHITLARYDSNDRFSEEFLSKIKKALARANEILKIIYPDGAPGISLVDGAFVFYSKKKDVVVFRVAESNELKNIQQIILKFLSFEGITNVQFNTFKIESPIHVTLGKIVSPTMIPNLLEIAQSIDAPVGIRQSQGESFIAKIFRASYSPGHQNYHEISAYAF